MGADVRSWYDEMPKALRLDQSDTILSPKKAHKIEAAANAFKIDEHFYNSRCLACRAHTLEGACRPRSRLPPNYTDVDDSRHM